MLVTLCKTLVRLYRRFSKCYKLHSSKEPEVQTEDVANCQPPPLEAGGPRQQNAHFSDKLLAETGAFRDSEAGQEQPFRVRDASISWCCSRINRPQNDMAAQTKEMTVATWCNTAFESESEDPADSISITTYTSDDALSSARSSIEPEVNGTRSAEVPFPSGSKILEQSQALAESLLSQNIALQAKLESANLKNAEICVELEALNGRYALQKSCRVDDFKKVQEAYREYESLQAEIEVEREDFKIQLDCKDQQMVEMKTMLADMEKEHGAQIVVKDAQVQKAHEDVAERDAEIERLNKSAVDKRKDMEQKNNDMRRQLVGSFEDKTTILEGKIKALEMVNKRQKANFQDELQKRKDEICQLTNMKYVLLHQLSLESHIRHGTQPEVGHLQSMAKEMNEMLQRNHDPQISNDRNKDKLEDLLAAYQKASDHFQGQMKERSENQDRAYYAESKVNELSRKVEHYEQIIQDAIVAGDNITALAEIEKLSSQVKSLEHERDEVRKDHAKLEDKYYTYLVEQNVAEVQNHDALRKWESCRRWQEKVAQELEFLRQVIKNDSGPSSDKITDFYRDHQKVLEENASLEKQNLDITLYCEAKCRDLEIVIKDQEVEIDDHEKQANYWSTMYFHEAVNKVERLLQTIRDLHIGLGRDVHVEEKVVGTTLVEDRAFLRYAAKYGVPSRNIRESIIPQEAHEPQFEPGWIPATHNAMRELLPLGWALIAECEKVWMTPIFKSFTEKDALARRKAQEQVARKKHRAKSGLPPPPETNVELPFLTASDAEPSQDAVFGSEPCWKDRSFHNTTAFDEDEVAQSSLRSFQKGVSHAEPTVVRHLPDSLAYRSSWLETYGWSREEYEELFHENKEDFIRVYVNGGQL